MKILHITPHLGGGVGTVLVNWAKKYEKCAIVCLDYANKKAKDELENAGISLMEEMMTNVAGTIDMCTKYDIIVVHYWDHEMLKTFLHYYPRGTFRTVFWCHKNIQIPAEHFLMPSAFVVTSKAIEESQKEQFNIARKMGARIYTIHSTGGVDRFLDIQRAEETREGFRVGYVGTINYKKLHEKFYTINYRIRFCDNSPQFIIVGEREIDLPEESERCRYLFTGKVDDIYPYLKEMDVFGYPLSNNHYGTSEQVIGEAMASGLPVVALNNPAERRLIDDGYNGFLCEDIYEYVRRIMLLRNAPLLRKKIGEQARKDAKDRYSLDLMIDRWRRLFEEMITRRA